MKKLDLNNGNSIPQIGLGTYKATETDGISAVLESLKMGYRLIDSAAKYENEEAVGKGILKSGIPREEILVTTKFWRENMGYHQLKKAFEVSLQKLGLDYIDIYLIHWPANARNYTNWQNINAETWRAMEELQSEGKIKSIGVSNFFQEHLEALFYTATVKPAINQIEFHPGYWQSELVEFCKKEQIIVQAWSPLARGKVFGNSLLNNLAEKYKKSVSQICIRWIIQHNVVVIPKTISPERMKENLQVFDFELSPEDITKIDNLPEMGFSGELPDIWPERIK